MAEPSRRPCLAVLGAGAWGTALAVRVARNGHGVRLWGRDADAMRAMAASRCNARYLPQLSLPPALQLESCIATALDGVSDVLVAMPSAAFHQGLLWIAEHAPPGAGLVWACKGFEHGTGRLLSEVVVERLGAGRRMAVLSGPTFAAEVARDLPTAVTLGAPPGGYAKHLLGLFHDDTFRVYTTDDVPGVQVGGAAKNVLAVAVGVSDGLGFGANSRAALIARGLQEMVRLGEALGGRRETIMGMSGLGDLVLTCTDDQSRNRRFGLLLGRGVSPDSARERLGALVEGAGTALEVQRLAERLHLDLPIMAEVAALLEERRSPREAVQRLLARAPRPED